jgi:hypothetical protein
MGCPAVTVSMTVWALLVARDQTSVPLRRFVGTSVGCVCVCGMCTCAVVHPQPIP